MLKIHNFNGKIKNITCSVSTMTFEEAFLHLFIYHLSVRKGKKRKEKEEKRWNITNSGLHDFMGSEDLRLVMEDKTPGERSRNMGLCGARARKVED